MNTMNIFPDNFTRENIEENSKTQLANLFIDKINNCKENKIKNVRIDIPDKYNYIDTFQVITEFNNKFKPIKICYNKSSCDGKYNSYTYDEYIDIEHKKPDFVLVDLNL